MSKLDAAEVGTADFTGWVRPHLPYMRMLAVRMTSAAVADDVVQEALELAWRKHGHFDETRGTARAWLLTLTADRARKSRRRRHEQPLDPDELHVIADSAPPPDLDLQQAIRRLSPRQRLAVELFYFLGLGVDEVAQAMSCAPGTVKSTLSDARAKLRGQLGEDR